MPDGMRLQETLRPADEQQDEQRNRQGDADRERPHHLARLALVVDEVKQSGAKAGDDAEQAENDEDLDPVHAALRSARDGEVPAVARESLSYSQYTKMNRPSHTTSTKCQYHATPSNAKWWVGV